LDGRSALSEGRYLHRTTQTQEKRRQTSMPRVGFEPTIPVFERAKTFHATDRAATVIGQFPSSLVRFGGIMSVVETVSGRTPIRLSIYISSISSAVLYAWIFLSCVFCRLPGYFWAMACICTSVHISLP
jgi:hypothetical protein